MNPLLGRRRLRGGKKNRYCDTFSAFSPRRRISSIKIHGNNSVSECAVLFLKCTAFVRFCVFGNYNIKLFIDQRVPVAVDGWFLEVQTIAELFAHCFRLFFFLFRYYNQFSARSAPGGTFIIPARRARARINNRSNFVIVFAEVLVNFQYNSKIRIRKTRRYIVRNLYTCYAARTSATCPQKRVYAQ